MRINSEKIIESLIKAGILGTISFGVSYAKNMVEETEKLNSSLMEIKLEIHTLNQEQEFIMNQIQDHDLRIKKLEGF